MEDDDEGPSTAEESDMTHFIAHVDVPSQKQVSYYFTRVKSWLIQWSVVFFSG